ncbi:hypothetical protein [Pseudogemmobacter faecipullorum]|uniref:EF-hand domain-containing protein n=1 Tax=Pseudogemmobacter faecipullorum TaxID=2755041 RepID=A0ABS8CGN2_9RHOB|nr:hypothetical protein [Pseudogemmobacter faecipullorum]MCB5408539.1 hypothetical protein [Pseudogemmobacter faecipullorum]
MRFKALLTLPALLITGAALAQTSPPQIADSDGSGDWSLGELQAGWPEMTAEGFAAIDSDGNGAVTAEELQTAVDNNLVQMPAAPASGTAAP